MPGLVDRSRRPLTSPNRLCADVETQICELRREHPRWGARRISHELGLRGLEAPPSRATVHRVMARNGLITAQAQEHKRKYKRWQREAPMHLWQLDIVGGVRLADGRECKLVTGIDDHSRFMVIAAVVAVPTGEQCARLSPRRCAVMACHSTCCPTTESSSPADTSARSRSRCSSSGCAGRMASPSG